MYKSTVSLRHISLALILMLAAMLAACAGGKEGSVPPQATMDSGSQLESTSTFPALPAPAQLLAARAGQMNHTRSASFVRFTDGNLEGGAYLVSQANQLVDKPLVDDNIVRFSPDWIEGTGTGSGLAYCIYEFNLPDYSAEEMKLRLKWKSASQSGNVYVGFANWGSNRWDWQLGPWFKSQIPELGDMSAYWAGSTTPVIYMVVMTQGEDELLLEQVNLFTQLAPVAKLQSTAQSGQVPASINFGAVQSFDPDGTITDFQWDLNGNGVFNEPGPEATQQGDSGPVQINYTIAGEFTVGVRVFDDYGDWSEKVRTVYISDSPPPVADLQADVTSGSTPLSVNFDASGSTDPDGTVDDYEWDFDGDGMYNEAFNGEEAGRNDPTPAPFEYSAPGSFEAAVRITDNDGNRDIATLTIDSFNTQPEAVLTASVSLGSYPLTVSFDASASTDPDNDIVNYEWDLDGDGIFSEDQSVLNELIDPWGNPVLSAPLLQGVVYQVEYDIQVRVRVTDENGSSETAFVPLVVGDWYTSIVAPNAGFGADLREVDGTPAVSYVDAQNLNLVFASNNDSFGLPGGVWSSTVVNDIGTEYKGSLFCGKTRLRVVDGNPAIAYSTGNADEVRFTRSTSADGITGGWPTNLLIDSSSSCRFPDMEIVNGLPALAYQSNDDMYYSISPQADGSGWLAPVKLDGQGYGIDLIDNNGLSSLIVWSLDNGGHLDYIHFTDASNFTTVTDLRLGADGYDRYNRLMMNGGFPLLSGQNTSSKYYSLQYSSSADGADIGDWSSEVLQSDTLSTTTYFDAIILDGSPMIVYRTLGGLPELHFAQATNASGNSDGSQASDWWFNTKIAEDIGDVNEISLAEINGVPALVYHDSSAGELSYMVKLPNFAGSS